MNEQLQQYARDQLKQGLAQCSEQQQLMFKRMYYHKDLTLPINEVVDKMPVDKLDWAMQQVQRTLDKVRS
jgi:ABC-type uncharacterized transport system fused permease/ATPase subunit